MRKNLIKYTDLTIPEGPSRCWNEQDTDLYITWKSPEDGSLDMDFAESEGIGEIVFWREEQPLFTIPAVNEIQALQILLFLGYDILE